MHGITRIVQSAAPVTASTNIGAAITFPSGGPWLVTHVWCVAGRNDADNSTALFGNLKVDTLAGDLVPDPAPAQFPVLVQPVADGINFNNMLVSTMLHEVNWRAPGKAQVQLKYEPGVNHPTALWMMAGIIFGVNRTAPQPAVWSAGVSGTINSAAEILLDTVQLSESAEEITGLFTAALPAASDNHNSPNFVRFRLESDDKKLQPAEFPSMLNSLGCTATVTGISSVPALNWIPLNIPVKGGSRINIYVTNSAWNGVNSYAIANLAYR